MSHKELSGRLARWTLKLQAFGLTIEHREGSQNIVRNTLSRMDTNEILAINDHLIDVYLESSYFISG